MGVCICSLAGTKACETCPNNGNSIRFSPVVWPQNVQVYGDDAYQRGLSEGRKQGLSEAKDLAMDMWATAHEDGNCKDCCENLAEAIDAWKKEVCK